MPPGQVEFAARGHVPGDPAAQAMLEGHAKSVVAGFNAAMAAPDADALGEALARLPADERGFAYEGAGMGLAALDLLGSGSHDRVGRLLRGHGAPYAYTAHVGAGWALGLFRTRPARHLPGLDPVLRWLALDGYGASHAGLFTKRFVGEQAAAPRRLRGYERRVFDQGIGRTLWFVECADPGRAARTIARFPVARRADLWGGVGTAASYTAVAGRGSLEELVALSGSYRWQLGQGAAFAAQVRHREGNVNAHTRLAVEVLCERPVADVVAASERAASEELRPDPSGASYERWRVRVREWLAAGDGTAAAQAEAKASESGVSGSEASALATRT